MKRLRLTDDILGSLTRMQNSFRLGVDIDPGNDYRGAGRALEW